MQEFDPQISADDLQMLTAEGGAVVGVEFVGQPASAQGLAQAIQEKLDAFGRVELAVNTEPGVIVQQGEEERAQRGAIGELESGAVHAIGHPEHIGQG